MKMLEVRYNYYMSSKFSNMNKERQGKLHSLELAFCNVTKNSFSIFISPNDIQLNG